MDCKNFSDNFNDGAVRRSIVGKRIVDIHEEESDEDEYGIRHGMLIVTLSDGSQFVLANDQGEIVWKHLVPGVVLDRVRRGGKA